MTIEQIPSPNYSSRNGQKITAVVLHYTSSLNIDGTIAWFQSKASQVSAHYVVGRDGRIVQMVGEAYKAWHAGPAKLNSVPKVNEYSLGIELVATGESGFTAPQMAALFDLLRSLVERYRIPPDRVVGHHDVLPQQKIDPDGPHNQFDWASTRAFCRGVYEALPTVEG